MGFFNRTNQRRSRVRKEVAKPFADLSRLADPDVIYSAAVWLLFVLLSVAVLGYDPTGQMSYGRLAAIVTVVVLIGLAAAFHISQYQKRLVKEPRQDDWAGRSAYFNADLCEISGVAGRPGVLGHRHRRCCGPYH